MATKTAQAEDIKSAPVSGMTEGVSHGDEVKSAAKDAEAEKAEDEAEFPRGLALALILASVLMAMFLVSLDRTILATAIPRITDDFNSLGDIGWYASAYMLTNSSFQLIFGRIYKFYSVKWGFLLAIGIFEIGSIICGAAPNSTALIVGRAVAGLGSAGIFSGAMMILVKTIPLHRRPMYAGLFGAVFGISSVVGPLLGGAFTDKLSWRCCFWINLPMGAFAIFIIAFILRIPSSPATKLSILKQLAQLDLLGTALFLPCNVSLILALQWGGSTYAWSDKRIIALLTVFSVLLTLFIAVQLWKGDDGTIPPRIIRQRSIACGFMYTICASGSMFIMLYYLPIWFQAIKSADAVQSGIRTLPITIAMVISSISSGIITVKLGYYTPSMTTAPILMSIGAGLITTFMPDTGPAKWISYQAIFGLGIGAAIQSTTLAAQAVLPKDDVSIGVSIMMFAQQFGGTIFVSVGQNVFASQLVSGLDGIPGIEPEMIVNVGATDVTSSVAPQYLQAVLGVYNYALTKTFEVALVISCLMMLGALGMEWKSIKKVKPKEADVEQEVVEPKTE